MIAKIHKSLRRTAVRLALKTCVGLDSQAKKRRKGESIKQARRILVLELWNIGDVVLTLPFLTQLRAMFPAAHITLLGRSHAPVVLEGTGLVDDFIETDLSWRDTDKSFRPLAYDWRELLRVVRLLRSQQFDLVFQAKRHMREHFILACSGIPFRVGYATEHGVAGALTHEKTSVEGRQKSDEWLDLLELIGPLRSLPAPTLTVSDSEKAWAERFLAERGISANDVVVGVHPGASVAEKRWPLDRFGDVIRSTSHDYSFRPLVFLDERGYGAALRELGGAVSAQVGLRQLIALINRCDVLLCNDSGPMHIAGALSVPTVAIFNAGIDRSFAPLGSGHRLISPPPISHAFEGAFSLDRVSASTVAEALSKTLAQGPNAYRRG